MFVGIQCYSHKQADLAEVVVRSRGRSGERSPELGRLQTESRNDKQADLRLSIWKHLDVFGSIYKH